MSKKGQAKVGLLTVLSCPPDKIVLMDRAIEGFSATQRTFIVTVGEDLSIHFTQSAKYGYKLRGLKLESRYQRVVDVWPCFIWNSLFVQCFLCSSVCRICFLMIPYSPLQRTHWAYHLRLISPKCDWIKSNHSIKSNKWRIIIICGQSAI